MSATSTSSTLLPATRGAALERLDEFLPQMKRYAKDRNHVVPGHGNVSRLSPATRTRLLLESEICEAAREHYPPHLIEKIEQEVWWRLYWKGWLEMRSEVWKRYRQDLAELTWSDRAEEVAAGNSGVAIMDHFARELIETGYLHNHARMWWAAFWIHVERLPWQLGADFFLRHLWDGDAASNTLSWRWVAGLHTKGKSYLVRRSNLERYIAPGILESRTAGLDRLENASAFEPGFEEHPLAVPLEDERISPSAGRTGIWIHDEDLRVEHSPLADWKPEAVTGICPVGIWDRENVPSGKQGFLRTAIEDGAERAAEGFGLASGLRNADDLSKSLVDWAREEKLDAVATLRPFTGLLADELPSIEAALAAEGIGLQAVRRSGDVEAMNKATAGFFGFWKKTARMRESAA